MSESEAQHTVSPSPGQCVEFKIHTQCSLGELLFKSVVKEVIVNKCLKVKLNLLHKQVFP